VGPRADPPSSRLAPPVYSRSTPAADQVDGPSANGAFANSCREHLQQWGAYSTLVIYRAPSLSLPKLLHWRELLGSANGGVPLSLSNLPTTEVNQRSLLIDPKALKVAPRRMRPKGYVRSLWLGGVVVPIGVAFHA
jgi:hypothetical protein